MSSTRRPCTSCQKRSAEKAAAVQKIMAERATPTYSQAEKAAVVQKIMAERAAAANSQQAKPVDSIIPPKSTEPSK